jgi:hypothetical protein
MKRILLTVLSITLLATGCSKPPTSTTPASPEAVIESFLEYSSKGNIEACSDLLADDVLFQQEQMGIHIQGKTELEATFQQLAEWNIHYTIITPLPKEGNLVRFTIRQTSDEYAIIGLDYVSADIEAEVIDGKIKRWTVTVWPEDLQKIAELTAGGTGIKIETTDRGIRITEIAVNSPLNSYGVKPGYLIIAVNGISYTQMREGEIQLRLRGPIGSEVKLTLTYEGAPAPIDIEIARIDMTQVSW